MRNHALSDARETAMQVIGFSYFRENGQVLFWRCLPVFGGVFLVEVDFAVL